MTCERSQQNPKSTFHLEPGKSTFERWELEIRKPQLANTLYMLGMCFKVIWHVEHSMDFLGLLSSSSPFFPMKYGISWRGISWEPPISLLLSESLQLKFNWMSFLGQQASLYYVTLWIEIDLIRLFLASNLLHHAIW